jgi:hypothetical protein
MKTIPRWRFGLTTTLLLAVSASLWALPEPDEDELSAAQHRYAHWRRHPEQLSKLQGNWNAFLALPAERREQILQVDHDLHQEPSALQSRLFNALERYTNWLDRLPEAERKSIQQAPDKKARLEVVRELRHREWMKGQPRGVRAQWDKLPPAGRGDFVRKLRDEERQRQVEWQIAGRFWKELELRQALPVRLNDLERTSQDYVNDILMPMLDAAEKERLKKAEGSWPAYPTTLIELADRHPPALPGPNGPRTVAQLPRTLQKNIENKKVLLKSLPAVEGKWPDFAIAVTENFSKKGGWTGFGYELWPISYEGLQPPMQRFVNDVLRPLLSTDEKLQLLNSPKRWPDYPQRIAELARAHDLEPPWYTFPDSRLEAYRLTRPARVQGYPPLPSINLRHFALYELDAAERTKLNLSPNDPESWQRLTESYFRHRPLELKRLRQLDARKRDGERRAS